MQGNLDNAGRGRPPQDIRRGTMQLINVAKNSSDSNVKKAAQELERAMERQKAMQGRR